MAASSESRSKRVLIVDDDADNRRLVAHCLRAITDLELVEAGDGVSALRALNELAPHLIILDMDMPLLDGYVATRIIRRSNSSSSRVPILALTAAATSEEQTQCLDAGANEWLAKPLADPDVLRSKVRAWLATPSPAHAVR